MKIDLNFKVKNLKGEEMEIKDEQGKVIDKTAGMFLADSLAFDNQGDSVKFMGWAMKLYAREVLDLDKSDQKTIRDYVDKSALKNIIKSQILETIDDAKESKK